MIGRTLGAYKILEPLGKGGMGEVYLAEDTRLRRRVAIKVLPAEFTRDPERLARLEREAQVLAQLEHPNIAAVYGLEEAEGVRFLAMQLAEGPTLAERIARGPIPLEEALPIALQIARGLEAAHEKGIVHRDLKPANIKVVEEAGRTQVKVLDFGLAKAYEPDGTAAEISPDLSHSPTEAPATRTGVILGTAAYMSPEQARGRPVDRRADIWAFGCVLYEMITGAKPFHGESASDVIAAILKDRPDWGRLPPATPPTMQTLLRRCLRSDLERRLHDIADARIEIDEALHEPMGAAPLVGAPAPAAGRRPAVPRAVAALSAAAALLALVAAVSLWFALRPPPAPLPAPPVMFEVNDPPLRLSVPDFSGLALSPDGATLVYRGQSGELFQRPINGLEATPIAGTENGQTPFFSPDGLQLGFVVGAQGPLQAVSLRGGVPTPLFGTMTAWRGGTWLAGESLIISTSTGASLLLLDRGTEVEVTVRDVEHGERTHRWPHVLPDGRTVLYTVGSAEIESFDDARIVAQRLDSGERVTLIDGGSYPLYLPGYLLFARAGTLMAVSFDPERLEIDGQPFAVIEGIVTLPLTGAAEVAVSASGALAYVPGGPITTRNRLSWFDRAGNPTPISDELLPYQIVAISPDGRTLALNIDGGNAMIWLMDAARGRKTRLTLEWSTTDPVWSPDGEYVAYVSGRGGPQNLLRHRVEGGDPERLIEKDAQQRLGSWSPDGDLLLYEELSPTNGWDIWSYSLGTRTATSLINSRYNEREPQISPGGERLAYVSDESGRSEVYLVSWPDLGGKTLVSAGGGNNPKWSRDGQELFYISASRLWAAGVGAGSELEPMTPEPLFEAAFSLDASYDVAPDGRFVVIEALPPERETGSVVVVLNALELIRRRAQAGR
jgi:hypothetical protein